MSHKSFDQPPKLKIAWTGLNLTEKLSEKIILNHLSGQVQNGDFVTIMGSSGAGKSTFLSLVTKTLKSEKNKFFTSGKITLNGQEYDQNQFFSVSSYVPQDDLLLEALTVKQTLDFQAQLKLYNKTQQERENKVLKVLKLLNLYEIRNSFIGGTHKKSISGGQKKRVAIANQLISDPICLILDEPTSGLDSTNSLKIISILSKLAKDEGKLIISTIHQPSTLMFQNFDKLLVMRKGEQVYFGQANNLVSYMTNLNIKIDERMNPTDFLMFEISDYKQKNGYKTPLNGENYYKNLKKSYKPKSIVQESESTIDLNSSKSSLKVQLKSDTSVPVNVQFHALIIRTFKTFIRSPGNQGGKFLQLIFFPFILGKIFFVMKGLLYYDILQRCPDMRDEKQLQNFLSQFVSFLFIGMLFIVSQTVYDTILAFPSEKQLILKQVHSNTYFLSVYYVTKLFVQIPLMLFSVIASNVIVYCVVGLRSDYDHVFLFIAVTSIISVAGYMLGIVIGTLCKNGNIAIQAVPLLMMPIVTYGGQIVNLSSLPWYSTWIQFISPLRYGFNILVKSQLQTPQLFDLGYNKEILQQLGLEGSIRQNLIQLSLLTYSFVVLSFVLLYMRKKLG